MAQKTEMWVQHRPSKRDGTPDYIAWWSSKIRFVHAGILYYVGNRNENVPNAGVFIRFRIDCLGDNFVLCSDSDLFWDWMAP